MVPLGTKPILQRPSFSHEVSAKHRRCQSTTKKALTLFNPSICANLFLSHRCTDFCTPWCRQVPNMGKKTPLHTSSGAGRYQTLFPPTQLIHYQKSLTLFNPSICANLFFLRVGTQCIVSPLICETLMPLGIKYGQPKCPTQNSDAVRYQISFSPIIRATNYFSSHVGSQCIVTPHTNLFLSHRYTDFCTPWCRQVPNMGKKTPLHTTSGAVRYQTYSPPTKSATK